MEALRKLDIPREDLTFSRLLARQSARNGDKPYLLFEDRSYSYRDIDLRTNRLANALLDFGLSKGDHVAILMGNCPETLFLTYALGKIGAVVVPINTAARGDLLTYFLTQSDSVAIVVGSEWLPRYAEVAASAPLIRRAVIVKERGFDAAIPAALGNLSVVRYEALERAPDTPPGIEVDPHDPHGIFYTSGTTGPSKGVVRTNGQCIYFSMGRAQYIGYEEDDVLYTCLPLFHGNAMGAAAIPALVADATLVLSRRFSARAFWDEIRRYGVTQFNLLSSMTNILWGQPESPADRDHRVRKCVMVPVAPFAPDFERRFNLKIVSSYSLTDFGQGTFLQAGYPPSKYRSAGKPRPGVEIAILDDDDRLLPAGEAGEICLRSDDPFLGSRGYYKMPQANEAASRNGWFHTGDRGYLDSDGYLYFVDRKKDAIRRRGENISSWEVEQVISRHPAVMEVAVFPVRSEMSEDEVMASIVLRPGESLDPVELIRFCEQRMSYFMVPRFLEFVEALPKTMTEKVQKSILRESAEKRLDTIWDREKAGIVVSR